jgi:ketosteroid isomerase-like protein
MSQENVEIIRQIIEAARPASDESGLQSFLALCDPGCELTSLLAGVEPQTYRGHDGIRRYVSDMADAWKKWRNQVDEVFEVRPDTVVATFRCQLVGKNSGVALEMRLAAVGVLSEGKLLRFHNYPNREQALAAVGLGE